MHNSSPAPSHASSSQWQPPANPPPVPANEAQAPGSAAQATVSVGTQAPAPTLLPVTALAPQAVVTEGPVLRTAEKRAEPDSGFSQDEESERKRARTEPAAQMQPPAVHAGRVPSATNGAHSRAVGSTAAGELAALCSFMKQHGAMVGKILAVLGSHINSHPGNCHTALTRAASSCNRSALSILFAMPGVDFNARNANWDTALICAARNGHVALVRALLSKPGVDVNARGQFRHTALHCAAINGHVAVVQALLSVPGVDVNAQDQSRDTALHCAAINGHVAVVQALLSVPGVDVNAQGQSRDTALICAARKEHVAVVLALLSVPGVDVNAQGQFGNTALLWAAIIGHVAVVQALLSVPGVDVNAQNQNGSTPLLCAATNGNVAVVQALLAMPYLSFQHEAIRNTMYLTNEAIRNTMYITTHDHDKKRAILEALSAHRIPPLAQCTALHSLLQRIFAADVGSGRTPASGDAECDTSARSDAESAHMLNALCDRLRFGKCNIAEVPALLRSISHLPREKRLSAAHAFAFGICIGHFRYETAIIGTAIANALEELQVFDEYRSDVIQLFSAQKQINLYRVDNMNLLCAAAKQGNVAMIRGLVRLGAHVNLPSPNGRTALATAVAHKQWAACVELISLGALPTLPDDSGYPMIYHLVAAFLTDGPETPALIGLIRYLIYRGVRFDIPVKNPDEKARAETPTVLVCDLLCGNAEQWGKYWRLLYGLVEEAPATEVSAGSDVDVSSTSAGIGAVPTWSTTSAPQINLPIAFPNAVSAHVQASAAAMADAVAQPPGIPSVSDIGAMLAAGKPLAGFIAWLERDPSHLRWQDAQSGQGLLHVAVAIGNVEAVRLLLARGLDRRLADHQGRTPAQLLPPNYLSSFTDAMARIAELLGE